MQAPGFVMIGGWITDIRDGILDGLKSLLGWLFGMFSSLAGWLLSQLPAIGLEIDQAKLDALKQRFAIWNEIFPLREMAGVAVFAIIVLTVVGMIRLIKKFIPLISG